MTEAVSAAPRWIVMPPAADHALWENALRAQAERAGLRLSSNPEAFGETDLALVQDAHLARESGATDDQIAVLLSQAGPLPPELAGLEVNPARHGYVSTASEMVRRALALPARRRFTAQQVARGPVRLFEDFELHIPEAIPQEITRRNRALNLAFDLYEKGEATWSCDILDLYAEVVDRSAESLTLDATGKPRFMAHGPYITMPAGTWKAEIHIEFSRPLTGKMYRVDWGGLKDYSKLEFRVEEAGLYKVEMDWTWETPGPCEFRLIIMEGIFDGEMVLHDIKVARDV